MTEERFDETPADQHLRLFPHGEGRSVAPSTRVLHHQHRLGHWARGQRQAARLLGNERRDPCIHQIAGQELARQGDSRQCGGARTGLDAAEPNDKNAGAIQKFGAATEMILIKFLFPRNSQSLQRTQNPQIGLPPLII